MSDFNDAALEDKQSLAQADPILRDLASLGARIRIESDLVPSCGEAVRFSPRGVVIVGSEARLVRAVLEPCCKVPLVAWPFAGLPAWVGALDLVIVLGCDNGSHPDLLNTVSAAVRRGSALIVAAPENSDIAEGSASSATVLVPTRTADPTAAAIAVMSVLHRVGLGPAVVPSDTAEIADMAAEDSSPFRDLSDNPAKDLALCLADALPLVWGGSVLAARAGRRIAEALRRASGRPVLAAGAEALLPVIEGATPRDPFADPDQQALRPVLVMLDDQENTAATRAERQSLVSAAGRHEVRVCMLDAGRGSEVDRYIALLQQGRYGAAYLAIGLGVAEENLI